MTDIADRPSDFAAPAQLVSMPLFTMTVFVSAALVFMVEPIIGRLVLPTLGGSPAVWNTSLAFFQTALLAGYCYAHLLQRIGSIRRQVIIHALVLSAATAALPLHVSHAMGAPDGLPPAVWLLGTLSVSIGAPFAALSATAPLIQAWYARLQKGETGADPYTLYAASNLGSLSALLSYPVIIEPVLRLKTQTLGWSFSYLFFLLLVASVAHAIWTARDRREGVQPRESFRSRRVTWTERISWAGLAALPSSLMLGVTSHITTDIASAPFLWVAPLALYLLTFIIAFGAKPLIAPSRALICQAAAVVICLLAIELPLRWMSVQLLLQLATFFLTSLVCHQALVARRPAPDRLTEFYLLVAAGGVIGGAFNAFIAPLVFNTVLEYPLVLILASLARPWGSGRLSRVDIILLAVGLSGAGAVLILNQSTYLPARVLLTLTMASAFLLRDRAWMFLVLCTVLTLGANQLASRPNLLKTERGFFGVLHLNRITEPGLGPTRELFHGTTLHGAQADNPAQRCQPLVYYAPTTPIGQVFTSLQARKTAIRIGAIGMGAGTVAAYTRAGDSLRFFEIDPLVVGIATNPVNFTYIHGCARGHIDWVIGDARLTLAREPEDRFDLLLVDAFSSDSVPAHLLTVEAMRGYLARIKPDGIVIMHLSNRNLELMSPVAGIAQEAGGIALQQAYRPLRPPSVADPSEDAIIVARNAAALIPYQRDRRWTPAQSHGVRIWTDDYTNLFGAIVRRLAPDRPH